VRAVTYCTGYIISSGVSAFGTKGNLRACRGQAAAVYRPGVGQRTVVGIAGNAAEIGGFAWKQTECRRINRNGRRDGAVGYNNLTGAFRFLSAVRNGRRNGVSSRGTGAEIGLIAIAANVAA